MARQTPKNKDFTALLANIESNLELGKSNPVDATAWFLGPKAENAPALLEFVKLAVESQIDMREKYMPGDPEIFTDYEDAEHQKSIGIIRTELTTLLHQLQGSIPLASYRNQSHMYWDITLPGAIGYFAAMLYNQNNVAAEASPVTTLLEVQVGKDLCSMLGFEQPCETDDDAIEPWGHITADGSIANGEAMWAARNLKFLPVALAAAIALEKDLQDARGVSVKTCQDNRGRLIDLTTWELLNLPIDEVLGLANTIEKASGLDAARIRQAIDKYSVQSVGLVDFQRRFLETHEQASPLVLVPATAHYSWPKTAALIGLGTHAVKSIKVDLEGRMDMVALHQELSSCLAQGRPVLQVVAVMGSTEEGSIDPLANIVAMRREFQQLGMNFVIHVDGAWGGYFASMLREPRGDTYDPAEIINDYPQLYLSAHFKQHFACLPEVDSITLDPHKSGFIPYPAGGLCYRNGTMRDLIAYTAPVVFHGGVDTSVGSYGIEGSKPGAAAASVYLSNKVIPLDHSGYGRLLGRCLFNSKRFYASLVTTDLLVKAPDNSKTEIHLIPFQRLPAERNGDSEKEILAQKKFMAENFVHCTTKSLIEEVMGMGNPRPSKAQLKARELFQEIGSDLSIVTYAFNFSSAAGLNANLDLMNELNNRIFLELSLKTNDEGELPSAELFVTASSFEPAHYGHELVESFAGRAGVELDGDTAIKFLISTTQNPWLSTTSEGYEMLSEVIKVLHRTAQKIAQDIVEEYNLDDCQ